MFLRFRNHLSKKVQYNLLLPSQKLKPVHQHIIFLFSYLKLFLLDPQIICSLFFHLHAEDQ